MSSETWTKGAVGYKQHILSNSMPHLAYSESTSRNTSAVVA